MSVSIRKRPGKKGTAYHVRYRLGGRAYPLVHGGAFPTMREAKIRAGLIAGELAAGRNPADALAALTVEAPRAKTLAVWADEWRRSRIDVAGQTARNHGSHLRRILPALGNRDPRSLTWSDVQTWIAGLSAGEGEAKPLQPSSVKPYVGTLRQLLDFCGLDPNPARDRRLKLPRVVTEEPTPPTAKQFLAILDAAPARYRLALVTMEQTALHVGELVSLAWGDVDLAESRFRLRRENVKGNRSARARSPQVPRWLMDAIAATCPLEDRTAERRVFAGFSIPALQGAMSRACKLAGIPNFSPRRPAAPARLALAWAGHHRPRAGRAYGAHESVHVARRLQPRPARPERSAGRGVSSSALTDERR
jgi:integrase